MTRPVPRRDPDRQLPGGAGRDRRGRRRLRDEDRDLRQGRPESPGRHRPGPRPDRGDDGGRDRACDRAASRDRRAVEAAIAAGAGDAEAYAAEDADARGPRPRRRGREPHRGDPARRRRARLDRRPGRLRLRHRPLRGGDRRDRRAGGGGGAGRRRGRVRRPPPAPAARSPTLRRAAAIRRVAEWTAGARRRARRSRSSGRRSPPTRGSSAVEQAVYADAAERVAIASSTGLEGEYESSSCYAYLQALAEGESGRETGLGFGLARGPAALDPSAIGREGAERAAAMIGAVKPASRTCPVVLDPTVAASFVGLIGGALGADAVQRGRSPFAGRLGEEVAGEAFALARRRRSTPRASPRRRSTARASPRRRTPLIEAGHAAQPTSRHLHRAPRRGGLDRQRRSRRLPLAALGLAFQPDRRARLARPVEGCWPRPARASTSPTSPGCTPASTRSPGSSRSAPRGGRSAPASWPSRCASSRSPATWSRCCGAVRAAGSDARWVPFGGSVQHAAAADRRDDGQRLLSGPAAPLRRCRC